MVDGSGKVVGKGVTEGVPGPGVGDAVGVVVAVLEPSGVVGVPVWVGVAVTEADGEAITGKVGVADGEGRGVTEVTVGTVIGVWPGGG